VDKEDEQIYNGVSFSNEELNYVICRKRNGTGDHNVE
jgi:hypothetical protein